MKNGLSMGKNKRLEIKNKRIKIYLTKICGKQLIASRTFKLISNVDFLVNKRYNQQVNQMVN